MRIRLKTSLVLLFALLTACSDSDDKPDALMQPQAELIDTGYFEIRLPGDASFHTAYLPETTPEDVEPEFEISGAYIVATSDQITVLESDTNAPLQSPIKPEDIDTDQIVKDAFGSMLKPNLLSPVNGYVDIYNDQKFIIHVNERRYIALLKIGTYVGGYDHHQMVWALYEVM